MAGVFISHSSKDKGFARKLAADLTELGHEVWLDEYSIRVGDCIVSGIEKGLRDADYVIVVLSPNSVLSGWVEREWKTKFWDEVESKRTLVLPVLLEDCDLPQLLKTKRYADFRKNYGIGLVNLTGAINPVIKTEMARRVSPADERVAAISGLLAKVQSRSVPLSQELLSK
jgi:hypothetical protein